MKKIKKLLTVMALSALTACCVGGAVASRTSVNAETASLQTEVTFETEYAVGATVTVPTTQIVYGGKVLETSKKIVCPDGTVLTGETVEIVHQGDYTVEYSAISEAGETLSKVYTFEGFYPLYNVNKKNSSAYYGTSTKYGGIKGRDGVVVSLVSGDSFEWGEVIDLSTNTASEHIVELYVTPNNLGTADVRNLCFVLTDIYDPTNYVTIMAKKVTAVNVGAAWAEQQTYVTAGANGQLQMGMRKDDADKDYVIYEGERYGREIGNKMGTTIPKFSLPGVPKYKQNDFSSISEQNFLENPQQLTISFNAEKNVIYAGNGETDYLVADLDAEECFDTLWGGFTTGEVYLSIKGAEYLSSSLNFVVTKVDGKDVGTKAGNGNKIVDREAPVLSVDVPETLPKALVNVPYNVFSATANDLYDGIIQPTVTVTSGGKSIEVIDGKFTPVSAAKYSITYSATDYSGNSVQKSVVVTAEKGRTLSLTLEEVAQTQNLTGTNVAVANYTINNVSGELDVKITATRITDGKGNALSDGISYDVKEGIFCPMYDGSYRIDYVASDYLTQVKRNNVISVTNHEGVVIVDDVSLPRYYISGMVYQVPTLMGYYFDETGPHAVQASVSWAGDGDTDYKEANKLFAPVANTTVAVKYTATYQDKTPAVKVYEVPAVDVGYNEARLQIKNYFVVSSGNAEVEAQSDYIQLNVEEEASVVFANTLQAASFALRYSVGTMSAYSVSLTAENDESKRLDIFYTDTKAGKMDVTIVAPNGSYTNSFNYVAGDQITLKYYDSSRVLQLTEKLSIDLSKLFEGFDGKVWLEANFTESGKACFYELSGQALTNISSDRIKPMIVVDVEMGDRMLNDTYFMQKCTIGDVLDAYIIAYMYMTTPDGGYATAKDGTVLDSNADYGKTYEILLDMYGTYTVYYYAKDTAGNVQTFTFQVTVVDSVAPEIKTEECDRFVAIGGEIKPAEYTVVDDLSSAEQITSYVCIVRPDGSGVSGKESITATMAGVYKIVYYAFDAYGNLSTQTYEITVY